MDANWRPTQGTESTMETSDWRTQLQPESRQRIVNKIVDTLKRHLPISGQGGLHELRTIAQRFEEKIYTAATSQSDYLKKISLKMLTMENKTQNTMVNPTGGPSNKPIDSGILMQSQVHNPGQSHAIPVPNQSQSRQQLLSQNLQNSIAPSVSNVGQTPLQNVVGPNSNMQNNMFSGSQRQMPPRQQVVPQQQQQPQNSQPYLYHLKQKLQPGNIQHSPMQPHIQMQQQQQPNLQPNQLQSPQHSVMQTSSVMQPSISQTSLPSLQQNQQANNVQQSTQPMLQQQSQSVIRQQQQQPSINNQQQTPISQQPILPSQQQQQQQQLLAQQSNVTSMQHPQLLGQQNNVGDMQQHKRLLVGQQNNLPNLQQHQQQQHQLINQQNNLSNIHQQQLGSNAPGLQQQQLLSNQSGNSGMQTNQHTAHMPHQSKVPVQQQSQQNVTSLLQSQGQQSEPQAPQQQLMPQMQSQRTQLQQQLGLQQQPNPLQRDMHQRLQASNSLLQQQNAFDQQKQLYQSHRTLPDSSSTSLDSTTQTGKSGGDDWQEEVYQKIKSMKESYLPELSEMHQKITVKLQLHEPLPHQPKPDQLEKLKIFKTMLERLIAFLQVSKGNILPSFKDKLPSYEKQIINFINTNRPRKSMPPGRLPPPPMPPGSQPQSELTQAQSHENQMNSQMQSTNLQSSIVTMSQNNVASLQHNSISSISGVPTTQQNMINSMQPSANLDSSSVNSLQQVVVSTQNSLNAPQQTNTNHSSSQGGGSVLQQNSNPLQTGSSMLQHQQLKQPQEQKMLQNQQFKHFQQQQLLQGQQMLQQQRQLQQATKQQVPAHMQTHQMPPLHQINDMNDVKMRQGSGVKPGTFQQHLPLGQRSAYPQQRPFPASSPHLLQAASPQIAQHSSPQVDQQNLPSLAKVSTPLQSANSPFVGPTPSPPLAPSPMPGDSEKPISVVSPVSSNAANIGHQQTGIVTVPAQSLAIGTPGISPSPLLAEFSGPDGAHGNALAASSSKLTVAEKPIERLIKAVKSASSKDLGAAVSDIGSVVSMIDRIAGSAPGNGSRAAVGEDLVAMTKCRLQARNFISQDGTNGTKRMRRYVSAMPLNVVSSPDCMNDSMKQLNALDVADLDSATTTSIKKPRIKANHALWEEIREINQRLIDTVVDISDEDVDPTAAAAAAEGSEGTIVKCFFKAVALSSSLKSQYASAQMSPIQPLRLLVPTNYPNCSPILLDKFPVESSKGNEDLSVKTKSRFSNSLRSLPEPMTLEEIARTWDVCARTIICEYAQQSGGGTFSSKYGTWENCLSAA